MNDEVYKYWLEQSVKHNIQVVHVPNFKSKEQVDRFIKMVVYMFDKEVQDND